MARPHPRVASGARPVRLPTTAPETSGASSTPPTTRRSRAGGARSAAHTTRHRMSRRPPRHPPDTSPPPRGHPCEERTVTPLLRAQRSPSDLRSCRQNLPSSKAFLPWGQEGFASSDATLPCVLPPLPRRSLLRSSATYPPEMLPSPYPSGSASGSSPHGDCTAFVSCGPQGRSPTLGRVCRETSHPAFACSAPPQLHGSGSCHGGALTHWVTSASLVMPGYGEEIRSISLDRVSAAELTCGMNRSDRRCFEYLHFE